jgi:hypothetical protein
MVRIGMFMSFARPVGKRQQLLLEIESVLIRQRGSDHHITARTMAGSAGRYTALRVARVNQPLCIPP